MSDFNIFFKSDVTAEAVQVTHNGKRNEILNGIPDWVYEGKHSIMLYLKASNYVKKLMSFFLILLFQKKCLHLMGQSGGRQPECTLLIWR